jgi:phosphohistidine swiveling domain-containing protein
LDNTGREINALLVTNYAELEEVLGEILDEMETFTGRVHGLVDRNRIFIDRMRDVGVISTAEAVNWGFTGPILRSTGVPRDLRKDTPYLAYAELDFEVPVGIKGDNYDRYYVRMREIDDPLLADRMHDLEDLANRLLRIVAGRFGTAASQGLRKDSILIARNLGPAELLEYDKRRLKGVILEEGSLTAHVVIVASPVALGNFRKAASHDLKDRVILWLDKDLTKHSVADITAAVMRALEDTAAG